MITDKFYKGELNTERIKTYKKLHNLYNLEEGTVRDIFSVGVEFAAKNDDSGVILNELLAFIKKREKKYLKLNNPMAKGMVGTFETIKMKIIGMQIKLEKQ